MARICPLWIDSHHLCHSNEHPTRETENDVKLFKVKTSNRFRGNFPKWPGIGNLSANKRPERTFSFRPMGLGFFMSWCGNLACSWIFSANSRMLLVHFLVLRQLASGTLHDTPLPMKPSLKIFEAWQDHLIKLFSPLPKKRSGKAPENCRKSSNPTPTSPRA